MTVRPGLGAPGVVTASDHRRSLSGLLVPAHATDPLVTRSGILPGPGDPLRVRQNSPLGMSVLVNAGVTEIYRTGRGPYAPSNDAVATVAITPAPGANSRWDLIYIAQADTEAGDANSNPTLTVATGTAIASPTKPYGLVPAGGYVLAEVGPILTSTTQITDALITNVSRFTALRGAPIWVRTQAERDELTALASSSFPITVERLDTGAIERNVGSGWINRTGVPPTTYTPTLTGMAIGTGGTPINTAQYAYASGVLEVEGKVKFGTTAPTFPAVAIAVSLPAGFTLLTTDANADMPSVVTFSDVSAPVAVKGLARPQIDATNVRLVVLAVSGTNLMAQGTGPTAPFTWQINDEIYYRFTCLASQA